MRQDHPEHPRVANDKEQVQHIATLARLKAADEATFADVVEKLSSYRRFCRPAAGWPIRMSVLPMAHPLNMSQRLRAG